MADLSEDQAAVYDRQLRVWGVEVQRRLSAGKVLLVGSGCLAAEVAKNIVLAGVGNVTLLDSSPSTSQNEAGNFLIPATSTADTSAVAASVKTLQAMNPYISVQATTADPSTASDPAVTRQYDLVVLVSPSLQLQKRVNGTCRESHTKFMAGCVRGPQSYLFTDLQEHKYVVKPADAVKPGEAGEHMLCFSPLDKSLGPAGSNHKGCHALFPVLKVVAQFEEVHNRAPTQADLPALADSASQMFGPGSGNECTVDQEVLSSYVLDDYEFAPVAAVLGGTIGNEIVKVVSQEKEPIKNFFFYTVLDGQGLIEEH